VVGGGPVCTSLYLARDFYTLVLFFCGSSARLQLHSSTRVGGQPGILDAGRAPRARLTALEEPALNGRFRPQTAHPSNWKSGEHALRGGAPGPERAFLSQRQDCRARRPMWWWLPPFTAPAQRADPGGVGRLRSCYGAQDISAQRQGPTCECRGDACHARLQLWCWAGTRKRRNTTGRRSLVTQGASPCGSA